MAENPQDVPVTQDTHQKPCTFLDKLPLELRYNIYTHLLTSPYRLIPPPTRDNIQDPSGSSSTTVDIAPLLINKQIYHETTEIFYSENTFTIHYDDLCGCWNGRTIRLNEAKIQRFKVRGINVDEENYPRLWSRCKFCGSQGAGMVRWVMRMPGLKGCVLAFGDVESFAACVAEVRKAVKGVRLETEEVGRVSEVGRESLVELRLPCLLRMWPRAVAKAMDSPSPSYGSRQDELEMEDLEDVAELDQLVYFALGDLLRHAYEAEETTQELQPFMDKIVLVHGLRVERLSARECAKFTLALAEYLDDVIAEEGNVLMADRDDLVDMSVSADAS